MKTYKLYIAKPLLIFYLVMFGAMGLAGIIGIAVTALGKLGQNGPPVLIFIPWLGAISFISYMWLRVPFEIRICDDTKIEFRSVLRTIVISPAEIKSVRAKPYALGFVDIAHLKRDRPSAKSNGWLS